MTRGAKFGHRPSLRSSTAISSRPQAPEMSAKLHAEHRAKLDEQWSRFKKADPQGAEFFIELKERFGHLQLTQRSKRERPYTWQRFDHLFTGEWQVRLMNAEDYAKCLTSAAPTQSSSRPRSIRSYALVARKRKRRS